MNRKSFLYAMGQASLFSLIPSVLLKAETSFPFPHRFREPPALKPGDVIGICCPSGAITYEAIMPAVNRLQQWGFQVKIGKTVGLSYGSLAASDDDRVKDFQQLLDDPSVKAILFGRGGYGMIRIIDQINFHHFQRKPKWLIGFSDITVLHMHAAKNLGVATIHSKMCNSFPADWDNALPIQRECLSGLRNLLLGIPSRISFPSHEKNRPGQASGYLIGGNLVTIESLAASRSFPETRGRILFIEDTEEHLYSIDRALWTLKRSGRLDHLSGLIVGGFDLKADAPDDIFPLDLYQVVMEKIKQANFPVCFNFPVGHQYANYALKCGGYYQLSVGSTEGCLLSECF